MMQFNLFLLFLILSSVSGTTISGSIKNSSNSKPIPNANIYFSEYEKGSISDSHGYFEIEVPQGQYTIYITNIGFKTYSSVININV